MVEIMKTDVVRLLLVLIIQKCSPQILHKLNFFYLLNQKLSIYVCFSPFYHFLNFEIGILRIRAKKHRRVRKIEEVYSGDESNCELSEISMLPRTPLKKQPLKFRLARPVSDQPSQREHNQTSVTFLASSWSDSLIGSRL